MPERRVDPDSYLIEIDRRLAAIQGELRPGQARPMEPPPRRGRSGPLAAILRRADPSEAAKPGEPVEPTAPGQSSESSALVAQLRAMSELQARLILAIEELVKVCASQIRDSP